MLLALLLLVCFTHTETVYRPVTVWTRTWTSTTCYPNGGCYHRYDSSVEYVPETRLVIELPAAALPTTNLVLQSQDLSSTSWTRLDP